MDKTINILIADDHQMFIDGIKALLRHQPRISIVAEVANGIEALAVLGTQPIDLLLTDIEMPHMNGIELTKSVKQLYPELKVLVLSMHNDRQIIAEILLAEAEGYILKNTGKTELTQAINQIMEGSTHYSPEVLSALMTELKVKEKISQNLNILTDRELEILKLIVQEYSTATIAELLIISPRTVDTHRKNIMHKTQSKTIIGLIKFAFRNEILN